MKNETNVNWNLYVSLFWSRIYPYFKNNTFPKESILLWGWIPYPIYKTSPFYNTNRIKVIDEELNVYYYVRKTNQDIKIFTFVNVMAVKDIVQTSNDMDYVFIKNLYDTNIGIHSMFDHEYKDHCWEVLIKEVE
jgi:hypothetical protein